MVKNRPGSIPGLGRSPGEGNGNPLQYSRLENPTDRGAWQATVHGVAKSQTRLSMHAQGEAKDSALLPSRDADLLEPPIKNLPTMQVTWV